jgi:tRNA threonylcarbamoyladenosine modification (KEOPS) complex  Pcc1 subunit
MSSSARATIRLKFDSEKQLTTLLCALTPEAEAPSTKRANIKLEKNGEFLAIEVEAKDTVALRATLNAFLRWINSTLNVMDVVEKA